MSDATTKNDRKKMTTEQRLDAIEERLAALTVKVSKLWGIALMDRETEMSRREAELDRRG